ncbi:unnamed protein product [Gongylonema pulchrum]|uniref:Uncharacterized protein n=1 Tax=Gongylonema pulchrum TaxID=637853 RepID=A0A183DGM6_9BILA|nr:unnamed protein product [Gongylonema pulchrum]
MNFAHVDSLPRRAISLPAIPTYALRYIDSDDELFNVQAVSSIALTWLMPRFAKKVKHSRNLRNLK